MAVSWSSRYAQRTNALRQNVAFVPGDAFYPDEPDGCHMRLSFSNCTLEQIQEGIRRLGAAVEEQLKPAAPIAR